MTADERWLAELWPLVREYLPPPPACVLDLGCGSRGGFVPSLLAGGYDAAGIDPEAPGGAHYQRVEFERAELPARVDAVVASVSLHHVAGPVAVLDRLEDAVAPGTPLVVIEWASERFDEQTALWCFERLADGDEGWLHRRRDEWRASGQDWATFMRRWAEGEHLHAGGDIVGVLDARLERRHLAYGPYFFTGLADTTAGDEQAAIDAGQIQATRIDWVGTFR